MSEDATARIQSGSRKLLKVLAALHFLAPLITRLVLGAAFAQDGWGKLHHLDGVTDYFAGLGIPLPHVNAIFISYLELAGGVALILGLFTRPFAALLGATMLVASFTGDKDSIVKAINDYDTPTLIGVAPIAYGMFLLWLLLYGPGLISVDALIRRALSIDAPASGSKSNGSSGSVTKAETL